jgi:hypothetical protein
MPVTSGANRRIKLQGCEKFVSAMELSKTAAHKQELFFVDMAKV